MFISQEEEDRDFEAGAEDMELRAMRLEAERELAMEAAMAEAEDEAYLEATLDEIGASRAEYEAVVALSRAFTGMLTPPYDFGDDDIPF